MNGIWLRRYFVSTILICSMFLAPSLSDMGNHGVAEIIHDTKTETDSPLWSDASSERPTEQKTVRAYQEQLPPSAVGNSKAQAMLGDPTAYKYVWGNGGDGSVWASGNSWDTSTSYHTLYKSSGLGWYDAFFSFNLGTTFSSDNAKSIDSIIFTCEVYQEANEGSEQVRIKALETNNKSGEGGDDPANYAEAIARSGEDAVARKSGQTDTTTFNTAGWRYVGLPSAWIAPGDTGYLTLYLGGVGTWGEDMADYTKIYSDDAGSAHEPYLEIAYTAWVAPTANSADIVNEPSELIPGQSYTVNTTVSDADGRTNLNDAYLYMSIDHSTYMVRFDWDRMTDTFSQGQGSDYSVLNTTGCASEESGANGYKLTWNFNITVDWLEGYVDYANSATDAQGKSTTNWNNENSWYTDKLWVHSISPYWTSQATYLEDGDYVYTSETLNITGYVYWYSTTTVYDLGFGTPIAKLYVDGSDEGSSYNDSLDGGGYYEIAYTTPASDDWDWSLDIQLGSIPTGMSEGASNDNGKNPLFLITATSGVFSESGDTVSIETEPATIIPSACTGMGRTYYQLVREGQYGYRAMEINDDISCRWKGDGSQTYLGVNLQFSSAYGGYADQLTYDISRAEGSGTTTVELWDYHPTMTQIDSAATTITGTHTITDSNWFDGKMEVWGQVTASTAGALEIKFDQLTVNFTSFSEDQVANRIVNDTTILDVITVNSKAWNTTFTITGIPTTYSYSHINPGDADYTDNLGAGQFILTNTSVGEYKIYLDTGMTWHDVSFSPTLPDGLSVDWQIFEWYVNETHLNKMPYPMDEGFYNLLVKDAYDNTIVSTNFTISSTDAKELIYGIETIGVIPLYKLTIPNDDKVAYSLDLTRNDKTYPFPLSPLSETEDIRVYGIASGANYTLTIYEIDGVNRYYKTEYTLSMPNHGYVYDAIDLLSNDMDARYFFDTDNDYWYVTVDTLTEGATIDIYHDDELLFDDYAENTDFAYAKSSTEGQHTVDTIISKTGYDDKTYNSTYYVVAASLMVEEYSGVHWVSDTYVQIILHTNWGNTSITITETAGGATRTLSAASEGTISWEGDHTQNYVNVTIAIDGGAQSLTWYDGYYYVKEVQPLSGAARIFRGLTAGDLILPTFFLLGGVFVIGQYNLRRSRKVQARTTWRQDELRKRGATTEKDLHPYDRRKLREKEEKEFGKPRNIRRKVLRQGGKRT